MVSNINLLESRRRILLNTPHIETISDTIASFETDVATKIKGCKVYFTPIQEGEGDPSPENVRPIHGWDGVTVTMPKGKNLLISDDPNSPNANYYHSSTGTIKYSEEENGFYSDGAGVGYPAHAVKNGIRSKLFIAPANMTITFSIEYKNVGTSYGIRFLINNNRLFDIHGSADKIWHKFSHTITMQKDDYIYFIMYSNIYWRNMQIEIGSVASDYEEYIEPTTITIPFPQTIYGGYVDLVKGEVVETNVKTTFGTGWNLANNNNKNGVFAKNIIARKATLVGTPSNIVCSAYSTQNTMPITTAVNNPDFSIYGRSSYSIIFVKDTRYETAKDFMENMSETEFTYELATPNVYQLTPQTLKALRGRNNIWSDANGNIEFSFYTH